MKGRENEDKQCKAKGQGEMGGAKPVQVVRPLFGSSGPHCTGTNTSEPSKQASLNRSETSCYYSLMLTLCQSNSVWSVQVQADAVPEGQ